MLNKITKIIEKEFILKSIFLISITIVGVLFEIIGLGLLIPLMTMIIDPSQFFSSFKIFQELNLFNDSIDIRLSLIFLILFAFILKSFFFTFLVYYQSNFIAYLKYSIQSRLIKFYLKSNYLNFISFSASEIIRNIKDETAELGMGLTALIIIYTDLMIAFGLIFFLIYLEGFIILIPFAFLFFTGFVIYILIKTKLYNIGHQRQKLEKLSLKSIVDSIGLFPEITVLNKSNEFIKRFNNYTKLKARYELLRKFIQGLPNIWFELLAVLIICLILLIGIYNEIELSIIVPKLVLYLAAAIKILPSFNRIFKSLQNLRTTKPAIDTLYEIFSNKEIIQHNSIKIVKFEELNFKNITFNYASSSKNILKDKSFNIKKGDWVAVKGKSGSGKSTLVKIICGLIQPQKGKVYLNNKSYSLSKNSISSLIAYVPQNIYLFNGTLKENILLDLDKPINNKRLKLAIDLMKISDLITNEKNLNTNVGDLGIKLSGGQKQRIGIARAIYSNKKILILDEATNALDKKMEIEILNNLKKIEKLTVIIISHRKEMLSKFCNNNIIVG